MLIACVEAMRFRKIPEIAEIEENDTKYDRNSQIKICLNITTSDAPWLLICDFAIDKAATALTITDDWLYALFLLPPESNEAFSAYILNKYWTPTQSGMLMLLNVELDEMLMLAPMRIVFAVLFYEMRSGDADSIFPFGLFRTMASMRNHFSRLTFSSVMRFKCQSQMHLGMILILKLDSIARLFHC